MSATLPNGFKIQTWTEVLSLLTIIVMAVSGLAWGLKLDGRSDRHGQEIPQIRARQDDVRDRLTAIEVTVRANTERLAALEQRIVQIERDHANGARPQ